ncbi:MAG: hypothetical protein H0W71_09760 [Sphingomonas sp.]|nr:hypothetical protein [Sphingomonas sp.]
MIAPFRIDDATARKIVASARLLNSDKAGEVAASARAIGRLISSAIAPRDDHHWRELANYCACRLHLLDAREWVFVFDMAFSNLRPVPKQEEWLRSIAARLEKGGSE